MNNNSHSFLFATIGALLGMFSISRFAILTIDFGAVFIVQVGYTSSTILTPTATATATVTPTPTTTPPHMSRFYLIPESDWFVCEIWICSLFFLYM